MKLKINTRDNPSVLISNFWSKNAIKIGFDTYVFVGLTLNKKIAMATKKDAKSVQSALSDLKRPPERLQPQCNYRPFIT